MHANTLASFVSDITSNMATSSLQSTSFALHFHPGPGPLSLSLHGQRSWRKWCEMESNRACGVSPRRVWPMKRRECAQWKEARGLRHSSHISLLVLNIKVWRSRGHTETDSFCCPNTSSPSLYGSCQGFCFRRAIAVGSELEVRSFCVYLSYKINSKAL